MSAGAPAIEARGLVKTYGDRRAVDGLDLIVEEGETFALLGPNGAGKTTTVEMLEGYRVPDAGSIRVLGFDPQRDGGAMKRVVGIMPQEGGLYPAVTPREALRLFARFYLNPWPPDDLLEAVGLAEAAGTRFRRLSGGQKQRLSLALALLPRPRLLFLDEPTAGMDPQVRRATWDLVERLRAGGTTILLTTHYLEEAEHLAGRVAIIDHGRLVALGSPAELAGGDTVVRVRAAEPIDPALLAGLPAAGEPRAVDGSIVIDTSDAPRLLIEVATRMRDLDLPVRELRVGRGTLEDVFLQLTKGEDEA